MKIDQGGIIVRLSSDPFIRETSTGRTMVSGFEISSKRKKTSSGEWVDDDKYYEPLRVSITIFGDTAEELVASGGLAKGAKLLIKSGNIAKPKRENVDLEVVAFDVELLEEGKKEEKPKRARTSGVKKAAAGVEEVFDSLGANEEDLPF